MAFPLPTALLNLLRRTVAPAIDVRSFDGGGRGRRASGMGTFHRINSEVAGAGASVRSRARYLAANNPWLSQAVANWAGALVGPGITPTPKHPDAATRKALVMAWDDTAKLITSTTSGNTKIGVAVEAVGNPSGSVNVRLNGAF